jgi:hypothetical protein
MLDANLDVLLEEAGCSSCISNYCQEPAWQQWHRQLARPSPSTAQSVAIQSKQIYRQRR